MRLWPIYTMFLVVVFTSHEIAAQPKRASCPRDERIVCIQQALKDQGFNPGRVDGCIDGSDSRTRTALRTYQQKQNVAVTGAADSLTVQLLKCNEPQDTETLGKEAKVILQGIQGQIERQQEALRESKTALQGIDEKIRSLGDKGAQTSSTTSPERPIVVSIDKFVPLINAETKLTTIDTHLQTIDNTLKSEFEKITNLLGGRDGTTVAKNLEYIEKNTRGTLTATFFVAVLALAVGIMALLVGARVQKYPVEELDDGLRTLKRIENLVQSGVRPLAPDITALDPARQTIGQPGPVYIAGANFRIGARVQFGATSVDPTFVRESLLQVALPPPPPQPVQQPVMVEVRVTNQDGLTSLRPLYFTYEPPPPQAPPQMYC